MDSAIPKQYLNLLGQPVITYTLEILMGHPLIRGVVVVLDNKDQWWPNIAKNFKYTKPLLCVFGGIARCHSVLNGLGALQGLASQSDWILVHDAVRPCLTVVDLNLLISKITGDPIGGILAVPVRDTLKQADSAGQILLTVDRNQIWHALTPQMFRLGMLSDAIQAALSRELLINDEAEAIEAAGLISHLVEGRADNIKITYPEDLALAEFFLKRKTVV
jgi:2-C-methyl-D-erythritol 4-phosphate cytidylyltransferase